jgi:hypothetical protein
MRSAADSDIAGRLFGAAPSARFTLVHELWPTIVGPEIAQRTEVVALDERTLRVRVGDIAWMRTLHRMQREIIGRLSRRIGPLAPKRLGFVEGKLSESVVKPPERSPEKAAVPPPPPHIAAAAEAIEDPELRQLFLNAAARYLDRRTAR